MVEQSDLEGLVLANFGNRVQVLPAEASESQSFALRRNLPAPVAGDRVRVSRKGVIEALLERRNVLQRPDSRGKLRPVAANIDQVFVVFALQPEPIENLIDRYLVACRLAAMEAILVCNKIDLLASEGVNTNADLCIRLLANYEQAGFTTLRTSTTEAQGIRELRRYLPGKTSILAGQSGVGKSSLLNAIEPAIAADVSELSSYNARGRHTTTTAQLYPLTGGGHLIDSPGIREFHLSHIEREDIIAGFPEFQPFAARCRFRNCSHVQEPGCELRAAHRRGELNELRWSSYWRIYDSIE